MAINTAPSFAAPNTVNTGPIKKEADSTTPNPKKRRTFGAAIQRGPLGRPNYTPRGIPGGKNTGPIMSLGRTPGLKGLGIELPPIPAYGPELPPIQVPETMDRTMPMPPMPGGGEINRTMPMPGRSGGGIILPPSSGVIPPWLRNSSVEQMAGMPDGMGGGMNTTMPVGPPMGMDTGGGGGGLWNTFSNMSGRDSSGPNRRSLIY